MKRILLALIAIISILPTSADDKVNEVSGVYVGGHIRRQRPGTITKLRESGFTYVILFNVDVQEDGTLKTDGETICENGVYVFDRTQPNYINDIKLLKTQPTSISRIEICIGGWGNQSYGRIKTLIDKQGTGSTSMLYKNFKALKEAIPEIDAVNNDQEQDYDYASAAKFHAMMDKLGYKTTIAPYTYKSYWQSFLTELNKLRKGACDRVMVQCYDGGAGNNPSDWHLSGITLHAGLLNYSNDWSVEKNMAQFERWRDNCNVTGGFVWVYNDESWDLNAWASGMNRVFGAKSVDPDSVAATFYSDLKYAGYAVGLPVGKFTKSDLALYGIKANDIESVEVKEGYKVYAYLKTNCTGSRALISKSRASMGTSYNNAINSVAIEAVETGVESADANELTIRHAGNEVRILNGKGQLATMFNVAGTKMMEARLENDATALSLQGLPRGIYVVRVAEKTLTISR